MENNIEEFLDRHGLELYHELISRVISSQKLIADGKTIVIDDNNVISAKVNYLPEVQQGTETLIFDSSPTYVIQNTETLVYVSNVK